ncbi:MAG TPA: hypothetical protein VLI07_10670 [Candidatus Binatus sp.]|nr:hypothetical protein [Candidatus Binatus sp.]
MRRALVAVLILAATRSAAEAAREPCLALKTKAAGTDAAAQLRCEARAARRLTAVDSGCLARADANLRAAFAGAARGGGCGPGGGATSVAAVVDAFASAVVRSLPPGVHGGPRCAAAKYTAVGQAAARRLGCHARALRLGVPVGGACLRHTALHLRRAMRRAESRVGCNVNGDAAVLDAAVDGFIAAVAAALK